ncbi:SDR family NAD(P)-dependent oxidoreductase [Legionella sp. PC997]|uniref:SDR family NAD(P)-dependent oxidoreductase n=1 Tax=Legionella sp. PC997 TaxID=2755562 RepID=UPI0015FB8378|nr:SDR family NAD(P)-dependent oxidoreductase [Legionella sp. PC997]QMT58828.1 3-oxoacyl-ACP reductase FabG [Legionella sp. PC997]
MELRGAIALVTGGAKGLGLAIATYLYEQGAKVLIVDLDARALDDLPQGLEGYVLDVTQPNEVKNVIQEIITCHGRIDILVNNAGVIFSKPLVSIMNAPDIMHDYESFRQCITKNMDSVFIMTAAVVEHMVMKRIKGAIVNISSISARGNEGQIAYSAAKAGVDAMTVTLSKELGRLGIRCNAVAPGFINTDSTRHALNESIIKHIQTNTPLRRLGEANNVALAVASLITNDFMNGVVLDVNGGLTI